MRAAIWGVQLRVETSPSNNQLISARITASGHLPDDLACPSEQRCGWVTANQGPSSRRWEQHSCPTIRSDSWFAFIVVLVFFIGVNFSQTMYVPSYNSFRSYLDWLLKFNCSKIHCMFLNIMNLRLNVSRYFKSTRKCAMLNFVDLAFMYPIKHVYREITVIFHQSMSVIPLVGNIIKDILLTTCF